MKKTQDLQYKKYRRKNRKKNRKKNLKEYRMQNQKIWEKTRGKNQTKIWKKKSGKKSGQQKEENSTSKHGNSDKSEQEEKNSKEKSLPKETSKTETEKWRIKKANNTIKKLNSLGKRDVASPSSDPILDIEASIKKRKIKNESSDESENKSNKAEKEKATGKRKHSDDDFQAPPKKKPKIVEEKNPKKGKHGREEIASVENSDESEENSSESYKKRPVKNSTVKPVNSLSKVLSTIKQRRPRPAVISEKREAWSRSEEENLAKGVAVYGVGNWAQILLAYTFNEKRNGNALKDKWRNMVRKRINLNQLTVSKVVPPKKEEDHDDSEDFIRN